LAADYKLVHNCEVAKNYELLVKNTVDTIEIVYSNICNTAVADAAIRVRVNTDRECRLPAQRKAIGMWETEQDFEILEELEQCTSQDENYDDSLDPESDPSDDEDDEEYESDDDSYEEEEEEEDY
jgi:hypothetical protein